MKSKCGKMGYLRTVLIVIITICCIKGFQSFKIDNQTLYNKIVNHFFSKELQDPNFEIDRHLCFRKIHPDCCCLENCRYHGKCCIDALFNNNITSVEEYVETFFDRTKISKYIKKLPVIEFKKTSTKIKVKKIHMVASCDNRQSLYIDLCNTRDKKYDIRVIADGFVYRNKYCALCHGFTKYSLATLELVGCSNTTNNKGTVMTVPDESCTLRMRSHNGLGYNRIKCKRKLYKPKGNSFSYKDSFIPHFRMLIYLRKPYSVLDRGYPICFSHQYYDIIDGQCKNYYAKPIGIYYDPGSFIRLQPTKQIPKQKKPTQKPVENKLSPYLKAVKKTFRCIKRMGGIIMKTNGFPKTLGSIHINNSASFRNFTAVSTVLKQFKDFLHNSRKSKNMILVPFKRLPFTELYGFSPKRHFLRNRVCADLEIITSNFTITPDCNITFNDNTYSINKDVTYWINVTYGHAIHFAARCKRFHLEQNCSMIIPNMSFVTMRNNSLTVQINKEKKTFLPEQYFPLTEGFRICLENEKEYAWLKQYYYFENLLSHIFLSVSLSLELLFLMVYLVWKKIRNAPQKNLIAFCIALFVCDITGLILPLTRNNVHGVTCKIVALLLHFFSLALCTWPCIVAYEVWLILRSRNVNHQSNYLHFRYSMVAWGIPFIITAVCLTIDLVNNGSLIRYGNQDYCWIFPFHARLAVYIVPLTLMTCGNSVLILIIVIITRREKRTKHSLLARNDRLKFHKMITKLFLLFGTAELIGLVQIPNATQKNQVIVNVIFGLLHNLLRSSRGIFLFLTFGCNTVIKKYRERTRV